MNIDQAELNGLSELTGFAQVLILRHVGDDEAERIAFRSIGTSLELHRFVLHLFDAARVGRFRFGKKIRLEPALPRAGSVAPARRVDVQRDEHVTPTPVRDVAPIRKRDEGVLLPRQHHLESLAPQLRRKLLRDVENDLFLDEPGRASDRTGHSRVATAVSGVDYHDVLFGRPGRWLTSGRWRRRRPRRRRGWTRRWGSPDNSRKRS